MQEYVNRLTDLARQLNTFASGLKGVRNQETKQSKTLREMAAEYKTEFPASALDTLFDENDLAWLQS